MINTTSLMGQYPLTIDDKGRINVPAEVRHKFDPERDGEGFIIVIGVNGRPWLYPEKRYESLVSTLASQLSPDEDRLAFDQMYFSMANEEKWDKQGRMPIPAETRTETKLGTEIVMVGVRDHFELWNPDAWTERKKELNAQRAELGAKQRAAEERRKQNGQQSQ
jgi:MraZ protein